MLKDEFERLKNLFHEAAEGKPVNLEEVFKHSLQMFEEMKEQMIAGSPEDRAEAMKMMGKMYEQMMQESKKITDTTGLSEEQLVSFAENPANFTPEQWSAIQASKEQIADAGKDLAKTLQDLNSPSQPPSGKRPENKGPKGDKSKWIRS